MNFKIAPFLWDVLKMNASHAEVSKLPRAFVFKMKNNETPNSAYSTFNLMNKRMTLAL